MQKRDYSLIGPEGKTAQEKGLVSAEWYACPIPGIRLKALMKRKNGPGLRDTLIWFGLLAISGWLAYESRGTWWAIPAFFVYGVIYTTKADSGWHEAGHGTVFRSHWMNVALFRLTALMTFKTSTPGRWSHVRHHSDTIIVGQDPEIPVRPPVWITLGLEFLKLNGGVKDVKRILMHCFQVLSPEEKEYTPPAAYRTVYWEARLTVIFYLLIILWSISIQSGLPLLFIGLPNFYGTFLSFLITLAQHAGLCEDVLDHRLNTRTLYMNPVFRFLYWNMNYHIEHHMFPMVPYHALPALHQEMKSDCPAPSPSLWAALQEVYTALARQRKDPSYCVVRPLPATARPYHFGPLEPIKEPEIAEVR